MNILRKFFGKKQVSFKETAVDKVETLIKPTPEISCITKTILKDLENINSFKVKKAKDAFGIVVDLTHKTKGYVIEYTNYKYISGRLKGIENISTFFNLHERDLINDALREFDGKLEAQRYVKQYRKDLTNLKKWFPECYK